MATFAPLNWDAAEWSAFGNVSLGLAAIIGGVWAAYNYWTRRRVEAAHWIHDLFRDFYVADRYREIKWQLVRPEYVAHIAPLLEVRLANHDLPLSAHDDQLLRDLDTLLNFFEHIMYLESQRHLRRSDREAMFNYWLGLLRSPEYAAVRKYVARFDYERLAKVIGAVDIDYVAIYGSLRFDVDIELQRPEPDLASSATFVGECLIPGILVDVGDYPGLVSGDGLVAGQLLKVTRPSLLAELDKFEGYDPGDRSAGRFRRRLVRLDHPCVDAWVYVFWRDATGLTPVPKGNWKNYLESRDEP